MFNQFGGGFGGGGFGGGGFGGGGFCGGGFGRPQAQPPRATENLYGADSAVASLRQGKFPGA